ncbi:anoctamin-8 [Amblyraja radiata]|uniref:anoctamin-8 n=1 Tax=Amblyraja radiata TaxID=386614 RepID=UPI001402E23D|nr:anoctamin-8 [Amblyraja radiata]
MSHKSWMKSVPTENCDVLMTFPDTTDDHTLLWLLNHIRLGIPELIIQIRNHKHTAMYAFFITATHENLLRGAEEMGLRKPVKQEFGGGSRVLCCDEDYIYENIENEIYFFTSQERQSIIRHWLDNLQAKQGERLHNIQFLEGQAIIAELMTRGIIQQVLPLHEQRILNRLVKSWVQAVCESQPIDEICDYFGVKIAMYFSWLGYYTWSMIYPAVIGFGLWAFTESDQTSRDVICVIFALFNIVWTTLFLEGWKRQSAELAYRWGTLDRPAELIEEPRSQFRGVKRVSPVTGCEDFYYSPWKRRLFQYFVSLPVCLFGLCFVFLTMLICFELQEFVTSIKELPRVVSYFPTVLLAVVVTVLDDVYKKIAYWLNDMENYRLQSAYEKHLIIKLVLFQFVNSYLSLFYIGFYLKDMERLKETLAALLITRQVISNMKEVLRPIFYERYKQGDLTLQALVASVRSLFQDVPDQLRGEEASPQASVEGGPAEVDVDVDRGEGKKEKGGGKCENGACGAPEDEEEEEGGGGQRGEEEEDEEGDEEGESILDCGLRLSKKVSFMGGGQGQGQASGSGKEQRGCEMEGMLIEGMLMEEGSPILVERAGAEGGLVFQLCEHDPKMVEDYGHQAEGDKELTVTLRGRGKERGSERADNTDTTGNRLSWMDPPDDYHDAPLTQGEIESCMQKYEDTFQDYQEMFIQFGYVVLFSSAFPLAAMCALINNVIEIRSDAFKLCTGSQRPFGQRVDSIGQWQNVMEAMGVLAIIVNCYLIGQCGQLQRLFPSLSSEMAIVLVVILEHFAFLLKYVLQVAIPDVPAWVAEEMAKLEYQRREAFKRHERQAQQRYQQQQRRRREEEKQRQDQRESSGSRRDRDGGRDEGRGGGGGSGSAPGSSSGSGQSEAPCGRGGGRSRPGLTGDKAKRPSSLLAANNVLKLKHMMPLQAGKMLAGASGSGTGKAPSAPPHSLAPSDSKLPAFLTFRFLKSPPAPGDKALSPTKPFGPGKLFNFSKSEPGDGGDKPTPARSHLNGMPEDSGAPSPPPPAPTSPKR